jgi:hypothetical protein
MRQRIASINDLRISESERKYHWPLGRRPDDHPSLSAYELSVNKCVIYGQYAMALHRLTAG